MVLTRITPRLMSEKAHQSKASAFACSKCGTHTTKEHETEIIRDGFPRDMECTVCGTYEEIAVTVNPASAHLMNEPAARSMVWYHATHVEDWYRKVSTGEKMEAGEFLFVHVGTEEAALDIAITKYFQYNLKKVYMYKVTLKDSASLAGHIVDDDTFWEDFEIADPTSLKAATADAVRYLNRWESPGSISMLVNASALELVSVETIRPKKK